MFDDNNRNGSDVHRIVSSENFEPQDQHQNLIATRSIKHSDKIAQSLKNSSAKSDHKSGNSSKYKSLHSSVNEQESPYKVENDEHEVVVDVEELPYEAQPEYLLGTKKRLWRFPALFLISGFAFGNYWCYDMPASLEYAIEYPKIDGGFGVTATKYGLLYSSFGIPNLFMPILAGIMFDKFGTRLSTLFFATLLCIGQAIYAFGAKEYDFNYLLAGRLVFGFGCCAMYVAQSAFVTKWFINYELSLGMACMSSFPLIGSFISATVIPNIFEHYYNLDPRQNGFYYAHLNGLYVCIICYTGIIFLCILDEYVERNDDAWLQTYVKEKRGGRAISVTEQVISYGGSEGMLRKTESGRKSIFKQAADIEEEFRLADLKTLEIPFWLTCFSAMATYFSIVNWIAYAGQQNIVRFGYTATSVGFIYTMPYLIATCLAPVLGIFIDKFGFRVHIMVAGSLFMIIAHVIQLFIPDCNDQCSISLVTPICLGISYATYCVALWGSIPFLVEGRASGTAFGICTALQNAATVYAPPLLGYIQENTKSAQHGYFWMQIAYTAISVMSLVTILLANYYDQKKRGGILNQLDPLQAFERYTEAKSIVRAASVAPTGTVGSRITIGTRETRKKRATAMY